MNRGEKLRIPGARGRAAGALALAGAVALGYLFLQPRGSAEIPGWEPVNAQVAEALGDTAGGGEGSGESSSRTADSPTATGSTPAAAVLGAGAPAAEQAAAASPAGAGQASAGSSNAAGSSSALQGVSAGASSASDASGLLNLNAATAEQLDALKGIGPAKAQAIVAYREQQGPFRSVDDLLNVKGIGPKLLEGIRSEVTV